MACIDYLKGFADAIRLAFGKARFKAASSPDPKQLEVCCQKDQKRFLALRTSAGLQPEEFDSSNWISSIVTFAGIYSTLAS